MIENKFKIEFEEDEDERRARKFTSRKNVRSVRRYRQSSSRKGLHERSVWNLEHGNMNLAILDVSVDEALARKAKDIYGVFVIVTC